MSNERYYSAGWCTWYVAKTLSWIPAGLGNADTWPSRARAKGLTVTMTPTKGSAVCYGAGGGYSDLGHVAVVTGAYPRGVFTVDEMAYVAWNKVDSRTSNMQDVVGFILPPSVHANPPPPSGPPPRPTGIEGARLAWADLAHFWNVGAGALVAQLNLALAHLRSI